MIHRCDGKKVYLSPYMFNDTIRESVLKWYNDQSFVNWIGRSNKVDTIEDIKEWEKTHVLNKDACHFLVYTQVDDTLIGRCAISKISPTSGSFDVVVGEVDYQSKGYGTDLVATMVKFGFEQLGYHRLALCLAKENERAHKCYKKVGFRDCGIEHEVVWFNNGWQDLIQMEYLMDWYKKER